MSRCLTMCSMRSRDSREVRRRLLRLFSATVAMKRWRRTDGQLVVRPLTGAATRAAAATLTLLACAEPRPAVVISSVVRDSAGVRIATFPALPSEDGPLQPTEEPRVTMGGLADEDSLEFLSGGQLPATELTGGQLVVGDRTRLKFFDQSGRLMRIAGRAGDGPAEFSEIRSLCPQQDGTLVVIDDNGRWSQWSATGAWRETRARVGFISPDACGMDGTLLVRSELTQGGGESRTRRVASYTLRRLDTVIVSTFPGLPASEYYAQLFFEPSFILDSTTVLVADPHAFELRLLDRRAGVSRELWRVANAVRVLTDAAWDSLVVSTIPLNATADVRAKMIDRWRVLGKPPQYPAFWRVRRDLRGRTWINPYFDHQHWYVIDARGARLSRVTLPVPPERRPQLVGFARDGFLVSSVDDDGAPVVGVYVVP